MKLKKDFKNKKWFSYTVAACSAVVLFVLLSNLGVIWDVVESVLGVLKPVIEGIIIAYIMHPVCNLFRDRIYSNYMSKRMAHVAGVASGTVCVILVFGVLVVALVPQFVDSVVIFASNMGLYARHISVYLVNFSSFASERGLDITRIVESGNEFVNKLIVSIPERANDIFAASYNFGMGIANFLLAFVLAVYFLLDVDNLLGGFSKMMHALLPPKRYNSSAEFWSRCNSILINYITFDIIDGFVVGLCNFVFMLIFQMPYAVLVSVVVGITNLAPTFGPIIGGIIGAFVLALAKPLDALIFVIFTLILQGLDGYVIKPRLFGTSLGVPAVWILITIIVGGNLFGVKGILLAIPFAAIVSYVYKDFIEKRLEEEGEKQIVRELKENKKQNDKS